MPAPPAIAGAYQALWRAASPLARLVLRRRVAAGQEDPDRVPERFGVEPLLRPDGPRIWIHAAGRGETIATRALILGLREVGYGGTVLATTFSPSGVPLLDGLPGVSHRFVPLDDRRWCARFFDSQAPDLGVVIEADIWPNLLWEADRRGIPLALCSARVSTHSLRRWQGLGRPVARSLFPRFRLALTIDEEQRRRFGALGVGAVEVLGCLKAAAEPLPVDRELVSAVREAAGERPVVVAASTHEGEEGAILEALAGLDGLLVIAPRYVDRGAEVAALAAGAGPKPGRRALGRLPEAEDRVWIADSMGELGSLFEAADLVILGGSFAPCGGHNLAEPARFGRPVITGPDTSSNAATAEALRDAGAVVQVEAAALGEAVASLLADPERLRSMGEAARGVTAAWEGRRRVAARRLLDLAGLG